MKTMTCLQLGGVCDTSFHGNSADEVIKADDQHLKDMDAGGDVAHKPAHDAMQARWKDPASGMGWYQKVQADFAALPED
ncbi:MAG TPA: hypothetical protein VFG51_02545 [Candidatus Saccharimonadia bacterium]|nr:hypothetical protein [Candidatus Saccharimonadia bacterium]